MRMFIGETESVQTAGRYIPMFQSDQNLPQDDIKFLLCFLEFKFGIRLGDAVVDFQNLVRVLGRLERLHASHRRIECRAERAKYAGNGGPDVKDVAVAFEKSEEHTSELQSRQYL